MKKLNLWIFGMGLAALVATSTVSAQTEGPKITQAARIGVLNTRKCLEESKASKFERANLDKMKTQMETVLKDKEKAVQAIQSKLQDEDYMDSISDEAERELKHKRKTLMEEGMELNKQFVETLENANMKIVQSLIEKIAKVSKEVAQDPAHPLDAILTSEACTFYADTLDVTNLVLAKLDSLFETEQKEQAAKK